ncbi:hypothetical protein [Ornithinibacillus contaminans]|uniref:hypothetical protein n=1 Tax=Ornithinibacillus contaminans TaxID=694055 RepID=UPI0012EE2282|nr:hypothetical protein [Ornithinibacillus contaminans]
MARSINRPESYYYLIPFSIFLVVTILMRFKLRKTDNTLTFQVLILNFTIYKKEVHYSHIVRMKFKRVGWGKKLVIVKNIKGFNFRISNFYPGSVYQDLHSFAEVHNIPISKTKDYLLLEK